MAKICVTGGAGFIASHVVDKFIDAGHQVSVIDDLSSGNERNLNPKAKFHKLDVRSEEAVNLLRQERPDIVVHAAAQMSVRASMDNPSYDVDVNVFGLVNLLSAFLGGSYPYFVFFSTGGAIYGEQESFPADEKHPVRPCSIYGLSKYVSEQYLDLWSRQFGLKFAALRLANVYGPRQNPHGEAGVVAIFCQRLVAGNPSTINGDGKQTRDFVYVDDVVRAVTIASEKRVSGIFNIGTGLESSVNQIYVGLQRAAGVTSPAQYGPAKAGEQLRSVIDSNLAKRTFAWDAKTDITQGLAATLQWFKQN